MPRMSVQMLHDPGQHLPLKSLMLSRWLPRFNVDDCFSFSFRFKVGRGVPPRVVVRTIRIKVGVGIGVVALEIKLKRVISKRVEVKVIGLIHFAFGITKKRVEVVII